MKMTETEIDGLTHRCSNPECHVPAFIATLKLARGPWFESENPEDYIELNWDRKVGEWKAE